MRDSDSVGNHRVIRVFTFDNGVVIRINPRDVVPVGQMFQQVSNQLIPGDVLLMNQNILHVKKRCQRETVFRGRFFFFCMLSTAPIYLASNRCSSISSLCRHDKQSIA